MARKPKVSKEQIQKIREAAESDLWFFARLVCPNRLYGDIHKELMEWWTRPSAKDHQLVLMPREHMKSHCAAVRAAWDLTRDPSTTILYVSATADLAEKQLYAIKNIILSDVYQRYWPEMVNREELRRTRWTVSEIIVDHPKRKYEGVRDPSIRAVGLTANITGAHADRVYLDDIVVPNNAYTEEGRGKVEQMYSQLASIENTGASEVVVGTRYHPNDIYAKMIEMKEDLFNEEGEWIGEDHVYEVFKREVEHQGVFIWPRDMRNDGKFFGFDTRELQRKKAKYLDTTQFYAQYYNEPNDPGSQKIDRSCFQYYDPAFLYQEGGYWMFKRKRLNVFAAMDFAYSYNRGADFTAIVVIGINADKEILVLDIDRFKTDRIKEYFDHLLSLHSKWGFRKIRCETSVAQKVLVRELKESYIKPNGLLISVDEFTPTRHEGSKEERIAATLEPRYHNLQMWHYKGGLCTLLEEELMLARPPHDDIKDALTAAIDIAVPPAMRSGKKKQGNVIYHSRFGGVRMT